jgi:cytochrome c556
MTRTSTFAALTLTGALIATVTFAQQDPLAAAVGARQAHMDLYAFNLGTLGGMAQGGMPYDAATAQAAADNIVALTTINQMAYWLPGTEAGAVEGSRAKAEIWANIEDMMAKGAALDTAAAAMQAAAGVDLAALQAAMGPLGGACGACHQSYRVSE